MAFGKHFEKLDISGNAAKAEAEDANANSHIEGHVTTLGLGAVAESVVKPEAEERIEVPGKPLFENINPPTIGERLSRSTEKAKNAFGRMSNTFSSYLDRAKNGIQSIGERVGESWDNALDTAEKMVRESAAEVRDKAQKFVDERLEAAKNGAVSFLGDSSAIDVRLKAIGEKMGLNADNMPPLNGSEVKKSIYGLGDENEILIGAVLQTGMRVFEKWRQYQARVQDIERRYGKQEAQSEQMPEAEPVLEVATEQPTNSTHTMESAETSEAIPDINTQAENNDEKVIPIDSARKRFEASEDKENAAEKEKKLRAILQHYKDRLPLLKSGIVRVRTHGNLAYVAQGNKLLAKAEEVIAALESGDAEPARKDLMNTINEQNGLLGQANVDKNAKRTALSIIRGATDMLQTIIEIETDEPHQQSTQAGTEPLNNLFEMPFRQANKVSDQETQAEKQNIEAENAQEEMTEEDPEDESSEEDIDETLSEEASNDGSNEVANEIAPTEAQPVQIK